MELKTPLHLAGALGNVRLCELLLAHAADVELIDEDSNTPLHIASENDNVEAAKLLLDYGSNINSRGSEQQTPLHAALLSVFNSARTAKLLVE